MDVVINIVYFTLGQGYGFFMFFLVQFERWGRLFCFFNGAGIADGEQPFNPLKRE